MIYLSIYLYYDIYIYIYIYIYILINNTENKICKWSSTSSWDCLGLLSSNILGRSLNPNGSSWGLFSAKSQTLHPSKAVHLREGYSNKICRTGHFSWLSYRGKAPILGGYEQISKQPTHEEGFAGCRRLSDYLSLFLANEKKANNIYTYLPTPPLGQDMTQGQFLSEV